MKQEFFNLEINITGTLDPGLETLEGESLELEELELNSKLRNLS